MVHVTDEDLLALQLGGDGAPACNADLTVVEEGDVLVIDMVVIDDGLVEGPEVVGGTTIKDGYLAGGCAQGG